MQGQTIYAYTALEVNYHCAQILSRGPQALGFDIEWRVTYKAGEVPRKTALLQLCSKEANGSYRCWLLHIAHSGVTPCLLQLLQSEVRPVSSSAKACLPLYCCPVVSQFVTRFLLCPARHRAQHVVTVCVVISYLSTEAGSCLAVTWSCG